MYMIKALSDYVWGEDPEQQTGLQSVEPERDLSTDDIEDEWTLVTEEDEIPPLVDDPHDDVDNDEGDDDAADGVVTEFGSTWIIAPPACFGGGLSPDDSVTLITSRENLLLEHPSLSVYASHRFSGRSSSAAAPRLESVVDAAEDCCTTEGVADSFTKGVSASESAGSLREGLWIEREGEVLMKRKDTSVSSFGLVYVGRSTDLSIKNEYRQHQAQVIASLQGFENLRPEQKVEASHHRRTLVPGRHTMDRMNKRYGDGRRRGRASRSFDRARAARRI